MKKILPAIPWGISAIGIALFAIVAKPALWGHVCNDEPLRINPSDRIQWRTVWTSLHPQSPYEKAGEYHKRMELELNDWAQREQIEDDLEEWINLSTQAIVKRDCLNQKDELFRATVRDKREAWTGAVKWWWEESMVREVLKRTVFDTDVCRPETRGGVWSEMKKRAKMMGLRRSL